MDRSYVKGDWQQGRAFSPAVVTTGAQKIIWLAGHGAPRADDGTPLKGDFEAQCRQCFLNLERTLERAGGTLRDIVTMTVFVTDVRYTTPMTEIRTEIFGDDFPASAAITVTGFADPLMLIEIQGIAVVE
ncbi:RidA family protein [Histidinibacterium aquaticum]|uniref:RidA family protein n=1 Tax=Histidinibacterium aquaticum TaxID=2613962 RepID=A0A5J5GMA4_9RHOB|nr:RidA family protein [Histidinibacterium aquaticum]KAA9009389.1 RidA family protein [Histidinibacterium aquaticum]